MTSLFIGILVIIPQAFCLNALFISIGLAGHVVPIFELAKSMNNHNITFLTQQLANTYINFTSYSSVPTFHVVYANNSSDAFFEETNIEQEMLALCVNHSMMDALPQGIPMLSRIYTSLLNKAIHLLMAQQFDVIVSNALITGVSILCQKSNTPCVLHSTESSPNPLDFNIRNTFSLLTPKDLTETKYRLYHVAFNLRMITIMLHKFTMPFYRAFQSLPQIPGLFYDSFTLKNILVSEPKYLELISMPPTFYVPTYSDHYTKYLGPFIDENQIDDVDNKLTQWIKHKATSSIIYAAFGSSSFIPYHRMFSLINGIAAFLLQIPDSSALLVFRNSNYDIYQQVLNELDNDVIKHVLNSDERVKVENEFVPQKWILQQDSVKLFVSHCGMGSVLEAFYLNKPVLCMPYGMDQFTSAMRVDYLGVGLSLFVSLQSLIKPYSFTNYTF